MKYFAPDYFSAFECTAGACRHSCCIGWEIDIDEETLKRYKAIGGDIGKRIMENIDESGEMACFRMAEGERCPFLNEEGLCELILSEGPDILCQICADHPRFRNFFADREEIGLGMCCEAAGKLILTWQAPVQLRLIGEDGVEDEPAADEQTLIQLRAGLIDAVQDRSMPVEKRIREMIHVAELEWKELDFARWADFLIALERLDDQWAERLEAAKDVKDYDEGIFGAEEWEIAFEQLMVYLLYRHVPGVIQDGDLDGRMEYAVLMWRILRRLCAVHAALHGTVSIDDLVELARLYSSEIEYSDGNVGEILDELYLNRK